MSCKVHFAAIDVGNGPLIEMSSCLPVSLHKRGAVTAYLCRHFGEYKLGDHYDDQADTYVFRLSRKGERLVLAVQGDFLKDRRTDEIARDMAQRNVATVLHQCGTALLTDVSLQRCVP